MQIRLIGTPSQVLDATVRLAKAFTVVSVSKPYAAYQRRGGRRVQVPGVVRVYLEVTR